MDKEAKFHYFASLHDACAYLTLAFPSSLPETFDDRFPRLMKCLYNAKGLLYELSLLTETNILSDFPEILLKHVEVHYPDGSVTNGCLPNASSEIDFSTLPLPNTNFLLMVLELANRAISMAEGSIPVEPKELHDFLGWLTELDKSIVLRTYYDAIGSNTEDYLSFPNPIQFLIEEDPFVQGLAVKYLSDE